MNGVAPIRSEFHSVPLTTCEVVRLWPGILANDCGLPSMKTIPFILALATLLLGFHAPLTAHPDNKHPGHAQHRDCEGRECPHRMANKSWSKALKLEGEKAAQVDALQKQFRKEKRQLQTEQRARMKALRERHHSELDEHLDDEQLAQLRSLMHHDNKPHRKGKHHGKQCPHHD